MEENIVNKNKKNNDEKILSAHKYERKRDEQKLKGKNVFFSYKIEKFDFQVSSGRNRETLARTHKFC